MAKQLKDKDKGGSKLSRSEVVMVRLNPKLRYLAELGARKHRRTLSSFIEWTIEESLKQVCLESPLSMGSYSIYACATSLWDVDVADRFAKLAINHPDLLTHEEQVLWKLIYENGYLWRGKYTKNAESKNEAVWSWDITRDGIIFERLREHWNTFCAVAKGDADKSILPTWEKTAPDGKADSQITGKYILS